MVAGVVAIAGATGRAENVTTNLMAQPLAVKSGPRGATMFQVMEPAQTGVVTANAYADPKMWTDHYQELVYGAIGTGIAVGDYDQDGKPDIFVVSKTGGCQLFRNLGGWKFEDVTERAGLRGGIDPKEELEAWKQGATFVDVNNDGWPDIYVCRFNAPNLLYINQGNGTFKEEAARRGLAINDASGMGAFCDYDRDGWLDVYITTNMLDAGKHPHGQRGYLLHNNGDGTFTNVTEKAGIYGESLSHSATWWDYDGDGWPDLYVSNDYAAPDHLYHNNRDGSFTDAINQVVPHMPYYAMGADLGDVNNDGLIDFFVADMAASTHEKDQRGMAHSRAQAQLPPTDSLAAPQVMHNALYLNTGTGRTLEAAYLAGVAATDWTWSVRFEDLDNDGRLDLFVTTGMIREFHSADLLARIMAAEGPLDSRRIVQASPRLAERNLAFRNLGEVQFQEQGAAWGLNQRGVSFGAAFADFDGDGDLDLVYANYENGVTLLRNDSDTGHRLVVALHGTQSNRFGVGATVQIETKSGVQVRPLVLARGYLSNSEPIVHFGLGEDSTVQKLTVNWPSGQRQEFAEVAGDQKLTITEPAARETRAGVTGVIDPGLRVGGIGPGSATPATGATPASSRGGQFTEVSQASKLSWTSREKAGEELNPQAMLPTQLNRRGPAAAIGDVTGDGKDDIVVGGTGLDPLRVLRGDATTALFTAVDVSALIAPGPLDDGPVLVFDADGDGTNDLLITKSGAGLAAGSPEYQPTLWLNDGHGGFHAAAPAALPPLPISVGAVAAADFDRDGHLDLFLGGRVQPGQYPLPPRSALLQNHGGQFEDVTDRLAPGLRKVGMVTSALWTDVDRDGWPDLLLALEWGGVRYWHNNAGLGFEDRSDAAGFGAAGTGWWTSLATADFNGDGQPDFVAGNVGLNTPYHASAERPALLYYGSFSPGGPPQVIEAFYEGEQLFPWRTRNELANAIPAILKRFPKNDLYAKATLPEILGADKLAAAKKFSATQLESGVFLSQPDGTYRFEPLPRMAQIAPLQGIVAGDFDGDGHADIYAVQNSFSPAPSVGRFDGGLSQLLRGDGHGHFSVVPPAESQLLVPGDAKALAVVDLDHDGWPDFFVTRNHGTTLAFRNNGVAGRHMLRVELRGAAGNRTAVGARVELAMADGSTQASEIAAGAGYFSQSSAACFFGWVEGRSPAKIRVRWPDGQTTECPVTAAGSSLVITEDGK